MRRYERIVAFIDKNKKESFDSMDISVALGFYKSTIGKPLRYLKKAGFLDQMGFSPNNKTRPVYIKTKKWNEDEANEAIKNASYLEAQGYKMGSSVLCGCGEKIDVLRCGTVILCAKCLETQSPIVEAWEKDLRELIKKYKDKGLLPEWMFRSFHFLSARIFDAFNEPDEVYLKTGTFSSWLNEKKAKET